jgi:hypothetical protein
MRTNGPHRRRRAQGRAADGGVARSESDPLPTIGELVLEHVRGLETLYSPVREAGPDHFRELLDQLGVLEGLTNAQQQGLAVLVTDNYAHGDKTMSVSKRDRRTWVKDGRRRIGVLRRRVSAAHKAIRILIRRIERIRLLDDRVERMLAQALAVLEPTSLDQAAAFVSALEIAAPSENVMVALYTFLVSECGLRKAHAEIRVGRIVNYFWEVKKVEIITRSDSRAEKWEGCEAVRKAVARHQRHSSDRLRKNR